MPKNVRGVDKPLTVSHLAKKVPVPPYDGSIPNLNKVFHPLTSLAVEIELEHYLLYIITFYYILRRS